MEARMKKVDPEYEVEAPLLGGGKVVTPDAVLSKVRFGWWQVLLVIAGGTIQLADGLQVTLLTFMYQCVGGTFKLGPAAASMCVAIVFAGEFVAAVLSGSLSDGLGRKNITLATGAILTVFGLLSAGSPNLWIFLVTRFMVGCAVGLYPVNFDLYAELLGPHRAFCLSITTACFPLGGVFCTAVAWGVLDQYGWRVLTLLVSLPSIIGLAAMLYAVEESPQYLMANGRPHEALAVLTRIVDRDGPDSPARDALQDFIDGLSATAADYKTLASSQSEGRHAAGCVGFVGFVADYARDTTAKLGLLFRKYPRYFPTALLMWTLLGTMYGLQVLTSRVYNVGGGECKFDYAWIFVTYLCGFFGGISLPPLLLDKLGRVTLLVCSLFFTSACLVPMALGFSSTVEIVFVAAALASVNVTWAGAWVLTPELFDTSIRATAHTSCFALARINAFLFTAIYGYTLSIPSLALAIGTMMFVAMLLAATLPDTVQDADGHIADLRF